ncbi:unnamed protein product, partial [Closterium sp. NIES-53]
MQQEASGAAARGTGSKRAAAQGAGAAGAAEGCVLDVQFEARQAGNFSVTVLLEGSRKKLVFPVPLLQVVPGAPSAERSSVQLNSNSAAAGSPPNVTVVARDALGNEIRDFDPSTLLYAILPSNSPPASPPPSPPPSPSPSPSPSPPSSPTPSSAPSAPPPPASPAGSNSTAGNGSSTASTARPVPPRSLQESQSGSSGDGTGDGSGDSSSTQSSSSSSSGSSGGDAGGISAADASAMVPAAAGGQSTSLVAHPVLRALGPVQVQVYLAGQPVPGATFPLTVLPAPPAAALSYAFGPGLERTVAEGGGTQGGWTQLAQGGEGDNSSSSGSTSGGDGSASAWGSSATFMDGAVAVVVTVFARRNVTRQAEVQSVVALGGGAYRITYTTYEPPHGGFYRVRVQLHVDGSGEPPADIMDGPFFVPFFRGSAAAALSTVNASLHTVLTHPVNHPLVLLLTTADQFGNVGPYSPLMDTLPLVFTATPARSSSSSPPASNAAPAAPPSTSLRDLYNGSCVAVFSAAQPGRYQLSIKIAGYFVGGANGPIEVDVTDAAANATAAASAQMTATAAAVADAAPTAPAPAAGDSDEDNTAPPAAAAALPRNLPGVDALLREAESSAAAAGTDAWQVTASQWRVKGLAGGGSSLFALTPTDFLLVPDANSDGLSDARAASESPRSAPLSWDVLVQPVLAPPSPSTPDPSRPASRPSTVQPLYDGTCLITFTPPGPGPFLLSIRLFSQHVPGSPFLLSSVPGPVAPERCDVWGSGLGPTVTAGQAVAVKVRARDRQGVVRRVRGDLFTLQIFGGGGGGGGGGGDSGLYSSSLLQPAAQGGAQEQGVYEGGYTSMQAGRVAVWVVFHNTIVATAAVTVLPAPPAANMSAALVPARGVRVRAGGRAEVLVALRDGLGNVASFDPSAAANTATNTAAASSQLSVKLLSSPLPASSPTPTFSATTINPSLIALSAPLTIAGSYQLQVLLNGLPLPSPPLALQVIPAAPAAFSLSGFPPAASFPVARPVVVHVALRDRFGNVVGHGAGEEGQVGGSVTVSHGDEATGGVVGETYMLNVTAVNVTAAEMSGTEWQGTVATTASAADATTTTAATAGRSSKPAATPAPSPSPASPSSSPASAAPIPAWQLSFTPQTPGQASLQLMVGPPNAALPLSDPASSLPLQATILPRPVSLAHSTLYGAGLQQGGGVQAGTVVEMGMCVRDAQGFPLLTDSAKLLKVSVTLAFVALPAPTPGAFLPVPPASAVPRARMGYGGGCIFRGSFNPPNNTAAPSAAAAAAAAPYGLSVSVLVNSRPVRFQSTNITVHPALPPNAPLPANLTVTAVTADGVPIPNGYQLRGGAPGSETKFGVRFTDASGTAVLVQDDSALVLKLTPSFDALDPDPTLLFGPAAAAAAVAAAAGAQGGGAEGGKDSVSVSVSKGGYVTVTVVAAAAHVAWRNVHYSTPDGSSAGWFQLLLAPGPAKAVRVDAAPLQACGRGACMVGRRTAFSMAVLDASGAPRTFNRLTGEGDSLTVLLTRPASNQPVFTSAATVNSKGNYLGSFLLYEPGNFTLSVLLNNQTAFSTPIHILPGPFSPSLSRLHDLSATAVAGQPYRFNATLADAFSNPYLLPGLPLLLHTRSPSSEAHHGVLLSSPSAPTLTATITVFESGSAHLSVTHLPSGAHLWGSPFTFTVLPGPVAPAACSLLGLVNGTLVGSNQTFLVVARDLYTNPIEYPTAGESGLTLNVTFVPAPSSSSSSSSSSSAAAAAAAAAAAMQPTQIDSSLKNPSLPAGGLVFTFPTAAAGTYTVSAKVGPTHVMGSPADVVVLPPAPSASVLASFDCSQRALSVAFSPSPTLSSPSTANAGAPPAGGAAGGAAGGMGGGGGVGQQECAELLDGESLARVGSGAQCVWQDSSRLLVYLGFNSSLRPFTSLTATTAPNATLSFLPTLSAPSSSSPSPASPSSPAASSSSPLAVGVGPPGGASGARTPQEVQEAVQAGAVVVAALDAPGTVGICDALVLDASGSRSLYGAALSFSWRVFSDAESLSLDLLVSSQGADATTLTIPPKTLTPGAAYEFAVFVTDPNGRAANASLLVTQSATAAPLLRILAPASPSALRLLSARPGDSVTISSIASLPDSSCLPPSSSSAASPPPPAASATATAAAVVPTSAAVSAAAAAPASAASPLPASTASATPALLALSNAPPSLTFSWSLIAGPPLNFSLPALARSRHSPALTIPPGTLQPGATYVLSLEATSAADPAVKATDRVAVRVSASPLRVAISGGDRVVSVGEQLLLQAVVVDADEARDSGGEPLAIQYTWGCEVLSEDLARLPPTAQAQAMSAPTSSSSSSSAGGSAGAAACFPSATAVLAQSTSSLTVPANALPPGFYRFSLLVSRNPLSLPGTSPAALARESVPAVAVVTAVDRAVPAAAVGVAAAWGRAAGAMADWAPGVQQGNTAGDGGTGSAGSTGGSGSPAAAGPTDSSSSNGTGSGGDGSTGRAGSTSSSGSGSNSSGSTGGDGSTSAAGSTGSSGSSANSGSSATGMGAGGTAAAAGAGAGAAAAAAAGAGAGAAAGAGAGAAAGAGAGAAAGAGAGAAAGAGAGAAAEKSSRGVQAGIAVDRAKAVELQCVVDAMPYAYAWKQVLSDGTLLDLNVTNQPLVLPPSQLARGDASTYRCDVYSLPLPSPSSRASLASSLTPDGQPATAIPANPPQPTTSASLTLPAAKAPWGGTFRVQPAPGDTTGQLFALSAPGWSAQPQDLPLSYTFGTLQPPSSPSSSSTSPSSSTAALQPLTLPSASPSALIILPPGKSSLAVRVASAAGAVTDAVSPQPVTVPTTGAAGSSGLGVRGEEGTGGEGGEELSSEQWLAVVAAPAAARQDGTQLLQAVAAWAAMFRGNASSPAVSSRGTDAQVDMLIKEVIQQSITTVVTSQYAELAACSLAELSPLPASLAPSTSAALVDFLDSLTAAPDGISSLAGHCIVTLSSDLLALSPPPVASTSPPTAAAAPATSAAAPATQNASPTPTAAAPQPASPSQTPSAPQAASTTLFQLPGRVATAVLSHQTPGALFQASSTNVNLSAAKVRRMASPSQQGEFAALLPAASLALNATDARLPTGTAYIAAFYAFSAAHPLGLSSRVVGPPVVVRAVDASLSDLNVSARVSMLSAPQPAT